MTKIEEALFYKKEMDYAIDFVKACRKEAAENPKNNAPVSNFHMINIGNRDFSLKANNGKTVFASDIYAKQMAKAINNLMPEIIKETELLMNMEYSRLLDEAEAEANEIIETAKLYRATLPKREQ